MKQKLIMTVIITAAASALISIIVVKFTFGSAKAQQHQVDVVPAISSNFPSADQRDFNSSSIDPTQLIRIGTSVNPIPFNTQPSQ